MSPQDLRLPEHLLQELCQSFLTVSLQRKFCMTCKQFWLWRKTVFMDSILLAYDIFHGALNRKNRSMVARHATTLVLRFHSPTRCIRHNPDLAFVRQRNLNLILREVEDYSVSVSCVRILGSSCSLCISCRFRDEVVRKVLHLKA